MGETVPIRLDELAERWLPVPGYEGVYSVSSEGRVRREPARTILKPFLRGKANSPSVNLTKDGKREHACVHVLVQLAFEGRRTTFNKFKLSSGKVAEIRQRGATSAVLGARYGVSPTYIRKIWGGHEPRQGWPIDG